MESHLALDPDAQKVEQDAAALLDRPDIHGFDELVHDLAPLQQDIPVVVKETKEGYKTTEFWLTSAAAVLTALGTIPTPHDWKGAVVGVLVAVYAVARGLAKKGVGNVEPVG